ncbi:unnamed protein product [Adineta ricciae]|uniref:Uncharacterized protein n=1 Tax=Adineta ricciae TaxID=249248 RepID=A0A816G049_ADIRI|nr:unnamed protein product [Adineta ricciae]
MQKLNAFFAAILFMIHIHALTSVPVSSDSGNMVKRSDHTFFPNENFALITNEKLLQLKDLADAIDDSKLHELYRTVNHYVQLARKNNEYVLWRYDANEGGIVLSLKPNLNGILYYGK